MEELGSLVVSRQDFQGPLDIIPVSDPNIFSEAQRYAHLQAVMQLAANPAFVPYFKADRLLQRALRLTEIHEHGVASGVALVLEKLLRIGLVVAR